MVKTSKCSLCKEIKPIDHFYKRLTSKKGIKSACKNCVDLDTKKITQERVEDGRCYYCKEKRLKIARYCLYHLVNCLCNTSKISKDLINPLIEKLKAQNYRCFYTGILLLPGINASIDHTLAKSKEGDNSIDNLIWVDASINRLKNNTLVDEFLVKYKVILDEYKFLDSFESEYEKQIKLNYILRTDITT